MEAFPAAASGTTYVNSKNQTGSLCRTSYSDEKHSLLVLLKNNSPS